MPVHGMREAPIVPRSPPRRPTPCLCLQDEPFHVPQTQRYCEGQWREWDPKITTFPGLYLIGAALGRLLHCAAAALGVPALAGGGLCGTTALRSVCLLFGAACLPLFLDAARRLDPGRTRQQLALMVRKPPVWRVC